MSELPVRVQTLPETVETPENGARQRVRNVRRAGGRRLAAVAQAARLHGRRRRGDGGGGRRPRRPRRRRVRAGGRVQVFDVRVHQQSAVAVVAARARGTHQNEVFPVQQVQLCDAHQGPLHQTCQVPFDADDQVRHVRLPHAVQVEPGQALQEPQRARAVQVFRLQLHRRHQAESDGARDEPPCAARRSGGRSGRRTATQQGRRQRRHRRRRGRPTVAVRQRRQPGTVPCSAHTAARNVFT